MKTLDILNGLEASYNVDIDILTKIYDEEYRDNENWYENLTERLDRLKYKMLMLVFDGYELDEYFMYSEDYKYRLEKYKSYIQDHIEEL